MTTFAAIQQSNGNIATLGPNFSGLFGATTFGATAVPNVHFMTLNIEAPSNIIISQLNPQPVLLGDIDTLLLSLTVNSLFFVKDITNILQAVFAWLDSNNKWNLISMPITDSNKWYIGNRVYSSAAINQSLT